MRRSSSFSARCYKVFKQSIANEVPQKSISSAFVSTKQVHFSTTPHLWRSFIPGGLKEVSKGFLPKLAERGGSRNWHSIVNSPGLLRQAELPSHPAEIARILRVWQTCQYYLPRSYPNLPPWLTQKIYSIPEGWKHLMTLLPKDWAIRPAFHYRVAIANAMYMQGYRLQIALPAVLAESVRNSNYGQTLLGLGPVPGAIDPEMAWKPRSFIGKIFWYISEWIKDCLRLTHLFILFLPVLVQAVCSRNSTGEGRKQWLLQLRKSLERAGPAFIKWGQWAATRKDLFSPDFCHTMEALHSNAPSHSLEATQLAIKRAFNQDMGELFKEINTEPIASGSIGQVYKARLSEASSAYAGVQPGTSVAVKVRHPNVSRLIERDFRLMMRLAELISWYTNSTGTRLTDTLQQFAGPLREQVDLAIEARNLWQFNYNFRSNANVRFPFPVYPLVTPEVLVETFEEGKSITSYVKDGENGKYNKRLAQMGTRAMLQMILVDNLIHFDLHPGNILVSLEPHKGILAPLSTAASKVSISKSVQAQAVQPHIILLDTGMAASLSSLDQKNMIRLFTAFAKSDGRAIAESILQFSGEKQSCPNKTAFVDAVKLHMKDMQIANQIHGRQNGAETLGALLDIVRQHQVSLPGHICGTVVTTLILEGWSSELDPEHSVVNEVQRIIQSKASPLEWLRQSITPDSLAVAGLA